MRMVRINQAFTTPRLLLGGEPIAVRGLIMICLAAFYVLATPHFFAALAAVTVFFAICLMLLRRLAAYDPLYFTVLWRWVTIDKNGVRIRPGKIPARPRYLPAEPWK